MKNTFGNAVSMTIFGESHGPAVGAVLDGLAAGLPAAIAAAMDRRRARGDGLSTARTEADAVEFLSGVYEGRTTGTAVTLMIRNLNTRSGDYAKTADLLRPGHADYTAYAKYEGFQDARGGGHFSGRITAASVAAGRTAFQRCGAGHARPAARTLCAAGCVEGGGHAGGYPRCGQRGRQRRRHSGNDCDRSARGHRRAVVRQR